MSKESILRTSITEKVLHFKQPAGTSRGTYTTRRSWFITLTDENGRQGIGECAPLPNLSCDDIPDYAEKLSTFCESFISNLSAANFLPPFSLLLPREFPSMLFGLETALLNLQAGSTMLFDTPFGRGEEGIPINGLVWMGTFEEMRERIEQKLAQGFHCVKLKIGAIDFNQELELLKKIRSRYSRSEIELRVDANGAFSPDDALQKLEQLSLYDIHSIEQPIRQGQWGDMAFLCRESPIPIALDEELIGVNDSYTKGQLLDIIKPAYIILKPSLHGGMAGTKEWIDLADDRHIGSWITSALESNVGLNAIAHLTAYLYGPNIQRPQGLGTGQLFTDNIPMPLEIIGDKLWYKQG
ncbi:MAG: o-succinylbenzoate synthase [Prevotella sp.]|nr:o-succinylbenzoate synthase [Prevotella sp.]